MNEQRKCLECGEPLRGRADQKFCNDQCRSAYNNRQFSESNNLIRNVNRILKKNYLLLTQMNQSGKTMVLKSDLMGKGFRSDYHTNTYITKTNRTYYFCYDQGYSELENNKVILVKRDFSGDGNGK